MVGDGLVHSWWAVLALPAALLIGFAFAAVGMALTTFMRSWQDFEFITLATMPMFLFSATFFPLTAYPAWLRWVVEATPLYRGVVLCRELTTGHVTSASLVSVVYLVVMGCDRAECREQAAREAAADLRGVGSLRARAVGAVCSTTVGF